MKFTEQERKRIKKEDTISVFSDDNFCIVIPKTHLSAKVYSFGSMWCTTDENSFNSYSFPLFIIIDKNDRDSEGRQKKFQLHFETEGFKNETCEDVNFAEFLSDKPQIKELFVSLIENNVYKQYRDIETWLSLEFMEKKEVLTIPSGIFDDVDLFL
jgi:hypothetical protein